MLCHPVLNTCQKQDLKKINLKKAMCSRVYSGRAGARRGDRDKKPH